MWPPKVSMHLFELFTCWGHAFVTFDCPSEFTGHTNSAELVKVWVNG